jgi:hypothetical protein
MTPQATGPSAARNRRPQPTPTSPPMPTSGTPTNALRTSVHNLQVDRYERTTTRAVVHGGLTVALTAVGGGAAYGLHGQAAASTVAWVKGSAVFLGPWGMLAAGALIGASIGIGVIVAYRKNVNDQNRALAERKFKDTETLIFEAGNDINALNDILAEIRTDQSFYSKHRGDKEHFRAMLLILGRKRNVGFARAELDKDNYLVDLNDGLKTYIQQLAAACDESSSPKVCKNSLSAAGRNAIQELEIYTADTDGKTMNRIARETAPKCREDHAIRHDLFEDYYELRSRALMVLIAHLDEVFNAASQSAGDGPDSSDDEEFMNDRQTGEK